MHLLLVLTGGPAKGAEVIMARKRSRSLLQLPGRTLLEHIVSSVKELVDKVAVAYDDPQVASACRDCTAVPVTGNTPVAVVCQALGTLNPRDDDMVTVVYGDVYGDPELYRDHVIRASTAASTVVTVVKPVVVRGSYLRLDVDEEGTPRAIGVGPYIYAGLLSASASKVKALCGKGDLARFLADESSKGSLIAHIWPSLWIDIDTAWDYMVAVRLELQRLQGIYVSSEARVSERAELEPPVYVEPGARVDANAVIRGPAYISSESLIGAHSFVRSETMVLPRAVVGAYTEVKRSVVCRGARIGSHSYIADSVVGEEAELAPYTVTVNIAYGELDESTRVLLTTTHPLEKLKVGAIIGARYRGKPHTVLHPGTVVKA